VGKQMRTSSVTQHFQHWQSAQWLGEGIFSFKQPRGGGMLKEGMYQEESPKPTVLSPRPLSGILRQHPLPEA